MKLNWDGIGDSRAEKIIYLHFFLLFLPCCAFSSACVIWTIWYGWLKGFEIFNSFFSRQKCLQSWRWMEFKAEWEKKVWFSRFCLKFAFKRKIYSHFVQHYRNYKFIQETPRKPIRIIQNKHKRILEKSIKITAINSKGLTAPNPLKNPKSFVTINFYKTSDFSKLHINIHPIVFCNQNDYDAQ